MGFVQLSRIFPLNSSWTTQTIAGPNLPVAQQQIFLASLIFASFYHGGPVCADDASDNMAGSFSTKKMARKHTAILTSVQYRTAQPLLCNPEAVYVPSYCHGADNQCSIDKSHDPCYNQI
jgi:hypothetical protein